MPDTPKEVRNASMAALDDGWGDLLDAAPPPVAVVPKPVPTFADDEPLASLPCDDDDGEFSADGVPLPTPVPLRTRVPTKPVLRGIRDESQPIDVLTIVRDVHEPSDGIPRPVDDAEPDAALDLEPTPAADEPIADAPTDDAPIADAPTDAPTDDAPVVPAPAPISIAAVPTRLPEVEPIAPLPRARVLPTPAPRESSGRRTLLFGVSGVAALFVVGVLATRPGADESVSSSSREQVMPAAASSAAARAPAKDPAPSGESEPARAAAPVGQAEPAAAMEPVAQPEPVAAPVPPALPPEPPAPASPAPVVDTPSGDPIAAAQAALDAGEFARAHALARDAFKIDRDNEAMRIMAMAACQLDDGVLARTAYRSLAGPRTRSEVFTSCRERGVDVRATTDGYTPRELLAKARRMADLGDPAEAYEIARAANRSKRSAAALELMGTCACKMKSADKAAYVAGLLGAEARQRIVDECSAQGVEIPPEG